MTLCIEFKLLQMSKLLCESFNVLSRREMGQLCKEKKND